LLPSQELDAGCVFEVGATIPMTGFAEGGGSDLTRMRFGWSLALFPRSGRMAPLPTEVV